MAEDSSHETSKWIDPDSKTQGVLLSDRIKFYVDTVHLIHPDDFDEDCLKYASYDLRVGDEYYHNDKKKKPDDNGKIVIPRNGLIFVKLRERLNIPYYMVAQHDLKVKQVYRGLLAGRSLQIDPGYAGHINYPIFNFTDEDKEIYVGKKITTMCFIKTTPFGEKKSFEEIQNEKQLRQSTIRGFHGNECKTFEGGGDRAISEYWYPDEEHVSTVEKIQGTLDRWREWTKRWAWRGVVGLLVTILLGFLGPILYHLRWVTNKVGDQNKEISDINAVVNQLRADIEELDRMQLPMQADKAGPAAAEQTLGAEE